MATLVPWGVRPALWGDHQKENRLEKEEPGFKKRGKYSSRILIRQERELGGAYVAGHKRAR